MPPFIPQKRHASPFLPSNSSTAKSSKRVRLSLFDTADQPGASTTLQDNKAFLDQLNGSDSESSLSDVSSDKFEDILGSPKSRKSKSDHIKHEEAEDEIDWEDAIRSGSIPPTKPAPQPSGDLELTLSNVGDMDFGNSLSKKKGPSKIERRIRIATHCMHVQYLLFHNLVRNGWACDKTTQSILVEQLPVNVKREVERWRTASGLIPETCIQAAPSQKQKGRRAAQNERNQRDWGKPAERQEKGAPNMSRGDPLLRLLKILASYWKKRWMITAPSLRKQGYQSLGALEKGIASFNEGKYDVDEHGERVRNIEEFRDVARRCEGSRDLGAQLFAALIRGLGIEARLVASLQPVGFGWNKREEASIKISRQSKTDDGHESGCSNFGEESPTARKSEESNPSKLLSNRGPHRNHSKGTKDAPIGISEDSGDMGVTDMDNGDDDSVIDVTPSTPRKRPNMNYDRDMMFPTYWTESISPINSEIYPVDPLVLNPAVATNAEHLAQFESRGAKADKAKQVFAYIVGYSSDGTVKDVTTRYLKRHMWPGRTKGVRLPVEKVPVFDHWGKIKHYEDHDWFRTVMSYYRRTDDMRTVADDMEEAGDLKVVKPEKNETKVGEDTLQGYKNSAEFVLERHLRREEAIKPGSTPVRTFAVGKGDRAKEEPVWLRREVEVCRTGENWHKEGRAIKAGEVPLKMVPVRAVTLTRKREVEEAERDSGEKLKQGLYSWDQTDWIIPPPIKDGRISRNAFGNIDCFVSTMVPKGAVHIPLRSTVRICKRLGIEYAEAVTGFEFGNKRAVPIITGVVVTKDNETAVIDEWEKDEEERRIKEEGKREKTALAIWRRWLMGLRIVRRVRVEYGADADAHHKEEMNPFTNQTKAKRSPRSNRELESTQHDVAIESYNHRDNGGGFPADDENHMLGGGFFLEGHDEENITQSRAELTIEEEAPSKDMAPVPLIGRTYGVEGNDLDASKSEERSVSESLKPKLLFNGTASRAPRLEPVIKSVKAPTRRKTRGKRTQSKRLVTPKDPDFEVTNVAPIPQKRKAAPRCQAARKSEAVVKSHYFDHESDGEVTESGDSNDTNDDEPVFKSADTREESGTVNERRSLRPRNRKK